MDSISDDRSRKQRLGKNESRLQVRALALGINILFSDDLGDGNILQLSLGKEPGHF